MRNWLAGGLFNTKAFPFTFYSRGFAHAADPLFANRDSRFENPGRFSSMKLDVIFQEGV